MHLVWLAPAAVAVVGMATVGVAAARAAEQARHLRRATRRMGELRPALVELGTQARRTVTTVRDLGH
jgi:hypothetical protein